MCYDVNFIFKQQLKRAKSHNNKEAITEIEEQIKKHFPEQVHYVSGFSHPDMFIYTQNDPLWPKLSNWGFVPHWCKEARQAEKLRNMCLNAVGETMFDKPSFRVAAREKRGVVYLNGFYDHHHYKSKTYPFYIQSSNDLPFAVATLYDEWVDVDSGELQHTFSIVTCEANTMMKKIHNKKQRMPLILNENSVNQWLKPIANPSDQNLIQKFVTPYPSEKMKAHTIRRLKGKEAVGNAPDVVNKVTYEELLNSEVAEFIN